MPALSSSLRPARAMPPVETAAAQVLAVLMATDPHADPRAEGQALDMLERMNGFARLKVSRPTFARLLREVHDEQPDRTARGLGLGVTSLLDRALDAVTDPVERLLVARLAAGVMTANGHVSTGERSVYHRMLARWALSHSAVARAILADPAR